jgi:hypothetical protein
MDSSKLSKISSIKKIESGRDDDDELYLNQSYYHKYLRLINDEIQQIDYKSKISYQQKIVKLHY